MVTVQVGDLEWLVSVPKEGMEWEEAKSYAKELGNGWRLPTYRELLPALEQGKLPLPAVECDSFWTSDVAADIDDTAVPWVMYVSADGQTWDACDSEMWCAALLVREAGKPLRALADRIEKGEH